VEQVVVRARLRLFYVDTGVNILSIVCAYTDLCPVSMGGLLAADTLLAIISNRVDKQAPAWPRIIACISFDTPV
jgi:hypothetical protein